MALTTACSDSPSKLKVASPTPVAAGSGVAAARSSMTRPVPAWIVDGARGADSAAGAPLAGAGPAGAGGTVMRGSVVRWMTGAVVLHPTRATSVARARGRARERKFMCGSLPFVALLPRGLGAHLRAAGLDALADRLD